MLRQWGARRGQGCDPVHNRRIYAAQSHFDAHLLHDDFARTLDAEQANPDPNPNPNPNRKPKPKPAMQSPPPASPPNILTLTLTLTLNLTSGLGWVWRKGKYMGAAVFVPPWVVG